MNKSLLKRFGGTAIGAAATLVSIALAGAGWLDRFENVASDARTRALARPVAATSPVKLIVLDQQSIEWGTANYQFTKNWPRYAYAPIIDFCKRGGAKVVAFDVLFREPATDPGEDEALTEAIKSNGRFVAAVLPSDTPVAATQTWPTGVPDRIRLYGTDSWTLKSSADLDRKFAAFSIPDVTHSAAALGHVRGISFDDEADPVVRRIAAVQRFDGHALPSLALAALAAADRADAQSADATDIELGDRQVQFNNRRFPLDSAGRFILRYRRPASTERNAFTFETYTAAAVMQSELQIKKGKPPLIAPETFKGAYVLFGFSAQNLFDLTTTPLASATPGVEVHATLLDNLLTSDLVRPAQAPLVALVAFVMAATAAIAVVRCTHARRAVIVAIFTLPVPAIIALLAYRFGYDWPLVAPQLAITLALIGGGLQNYATEGRQRQFIAHAFQHYLSPQVIEQLMEDPSRLFLGGERREVSIFFSDIQGFTTISQSLDPQTLADLLNEYLTDMTDIIQSLDGTLDKYIGDAIVAFWNAPVDQPDHALRACRAAVLCQRKLAERREYYRSRIGRELNTRIGLNTGIVSVGNFGSRNHFDYTMIGDAANLTSRLEGANKAFDTSAMVSESMWAQLGGKVQGREIGRIKVVGRDALVRVFEPCALEGEPLNLLIQNFLHAQSLCKQGPHYWPEAAAALAVLTDDPLAQVYLERLTELQNSGAAAWDDVWNLTSK